MKDDINERPRPSFRSPALPPSSFPKPVYHIATGRTTGALAPATGRPQRRQNLAAAALSERHCRAG